jgi:hypothetical protein
MVGGCLVLRAARSDVATATPSVTATTSLSPAATTSPSAIATTGRGLLIQTSSGTLLRSFQDSPPRGQVWRRIEQHAMLLIVKGPEPFASRHPPSQSRRDPASSATAAAPTCLGRWVKMRNLLTWRRSWTAYAPCGGRHQRRSLPTQTEMLGEPTDEHQEHARPLDDVEVSGKVPVATSAEPVSYPRLTRNSVACLPNGARRSVCGSSSAAGPTRGLTYLQLCCI